MEINKTVSVIIIIFIAGLVIFLFAMPKYSQSADLARTLSERQAYYDGESAYFEKVAVLLKSIHDRPEAIEKVDSAIPSEYSLSSLVYFFQKKVSQAGLVAKSITFSQITPVGPGAANSSGSSQQVREIFFMLDLIGNYQALKNFMASIESSARLFEINTVSFTSLQSGQSLLPNENKTQTYNIRLEIKTHTY